MVLFEDDASDDDFQPNFDVQEHLAGKNGLKVITNCFFRLLIFFNSTF